MFFGKGCTRSALDVQCIADAECFLRCLPLDIVYADYLTCDTPLSGQHSDSQG